MRTRDLLPGLLTALAFLSQANDAAAQYPTRFDSSRMSSSEMAAYWRRVYDSARNTAEYKAILERAQRRTTGSPAYGGMSLFSGVVHSDLSNLNTQLAAAGFPRLSEYGGLIGFGFNGRHNRVMTDFTLAAMINGKSRKGDETYRTGGGGLIRFDVGVNLLNAKKVALYPYGGLALRIAWIKYERPVDINPNGVLLGDYAIPHSVEARSNRFGYAGGLGMDFQLRESKDGLRQTWLFVKGGVAGAFGGEKYKVNGPVYDPGIKPYDWEVQLGFKFVVRR